MLWCTLRAKNDDRHRSPSLDYHEKDRILVMREGRLLEQGTHVELMTNAGYYAHLVEQGLTNTTLTQKEDA